MPRIYKDGVLYNTAPSTASQLPYDNNTSTKDKIDSKADSSSLATVATTGAYSDLSGKPTIDTSLDTSSNNAIANSAVTTALGNKAPKSDLASISITGTKNNTGSTIGNGTFFYLNGSLVRSKQDIQNTADFTTTNIETVTAGGLNRIMTDVYKSEYYVALDVITFSNQGYNSVYESTTELRLFFSPQKSIKNVSSFTLNITRLEVYCDGNDNEQASYITSATAEKRGEQIYIRVLGNFVNAVRRVPIFLVISGTITINS